MSELKLLDIDVNQADTYLWTNSTIILSWIIHTRQFQAYVENRIARIYDLIITIPTFQRSGYMFPLPITPLI